MISENVMVRFRRLKNWRGYPLCGRVIDADGEYAIVKAYGYEGAGTETEINDVPIADLEKMENQWPENAQRRMQSLDELADQAQELDMGY